MTRFHILAVAMVWLSAVASLPAALPPKPAETPAARAFRLAGFTASREVGCGWSVAVFKAGPNVGDAELKSLIDPGELLVLDLSNSRVSDAGIKDVAKFSKLYRLNLCGSRTTLACLKDLTEFKYLPVQLDSTQIIAESARAISGDKKSNFVLNIEPINDAAFHALSEAHCVHMLAGAMGKTPRRAESDETIESLILQSTDITDAAMKDVAPLRNLASLQLITSAMTGSGMRELTALPHLSQLNLNSPKVNDAGLKEIARLENLKSLNLRYAKLNGTELRYFAHDVGLSITLDESVITPENLHEISQGGIPSWSLVFFFTDKSLHALRQAGMLHLLSGAVTRDGARPRSADEVYSFTATYVGRRLTAIGLSELAAFKNLQVLDLQDVNLDDALLGSLAGFDHLTKLDLSGTETTDAGLKLLARQKNLTWLNVQDTTVTKKGVAELQAALPNCVIKSSQP